MKCGHFASVIKANPHIYLILLSQRKKMIKKPSCCKTIFPWQCFLYDIITFNNLHEILKLTRELGNLLMVITPFHNPLRSKLRKVPLWQAPKHASSGSEAYLLPKITEITPSKIIYQNQVFLSILNFYRAWWLTSVILEFRREEEADHCKSS